VILHGVTTYKLIEIALLTVRGLVLHNQRQVAILEILEPLVPTDFFQRVSAAISRKIQTDNSGIVIGMGPSNRGRSGVPFFGPATDFLMVC
jgi:hypothetical protein